MSPSRVRCSPPMPPRLLCLPVEFSSHLHSPHTVHTSPFTPLLLTPCGSPFLRRCGASKTLPSPALLIFCVTRTLGPFLSFLKQFSLTFQFLPSQIHYLACESFSLPAEFSHHTPHLSFLFSCCERRGFPFLWDPSCYLLALIHSTANMPSLLPRHIPSWHPTNPNTCHLLNLSSLLIPTVHWIGLSLSTLHYFFNSFHPVYFIAKLTEFSFQVYFHRAWQIIYLRETTFLSFNSCHTWTFTFCSLCCWTISTHCSHYQQDDFSQIKNCIIPFSWRYFFIGLIASRCQRKNDLNIALKSTLTSPLLFCLVFLLTTCFMFFCLSIIHSEVNRAGSIVFKDKGDKLRVNKNVLKLVN